MRNSEAPGASDFTGFIFALIVLLLAFYLDRQQRNQIDDLRHRVTMLELSRGVQR